MQNKFITEAIAETHKLNMDEFTRAYIECALWAETTTVKDDDNEDLDINFSDHYDIEDIAPETIGAMIADCQRFQLEYSAALKNAYQKQIRTKDGMQDYTASQSGHDFWLTRNGHGAGFWDRGIGKEGEILSDACGWKTAFPNVDLYLGDDGKIYAS